MFFFTKLYYRWAVLFLFAVIGIIFSLHFFPSAFPLIHIQLTMRRSEALLAADAIAHQHHYGPSGYQQAAEFSTDLHAQTFIELEGGGKEQFIATIEQHLYEPYSWHVRHFVPSLKHEVSFFFKPDGIPYGFYETIPENVAGAALKEAEARSLAEHTARIIWKLDLDPFKLIETTHDTKQNGRVDYTFTYERVDEKLGEGRYRVALYVSGDKCTGLRHSIKIPEAFNRRYQQMRSSNNTISYIAFVLVILLYIFLGCLGGFLFLYHRRACLYKQALIWAIIIGSISALVQLNQFELLWVHYDTALHPLQFFLNFCQKLLFSFAAQVACFQFLFMIAEGLTRMAFGNHPQFWHTWRVSAASSKFIARSTLLSYFFVVGFFVFIVTWYTFATRTLHWWVPSFSLFDPNILATYQPWIAAVAPALQAGFVEECLFRAIPLAGAALLGKYYGKTNLFIGLALIIQAVIFGAAHANYPGLPAYARLVELIIPSLAFGGLYLRFGLLPAIISHVVYDIVLMSLPIFVAVGCYARINQVIVILCALFPLFVILGARLKTGMWQQLANTEYNAAWKPKPKQEYVPQPKQLVTTANLSKTSIISILFFAILGAIIYYTVSRFSNDALPVFVSRSQAIEKATGYLEKTDKFQQKKWTIFAVFHDSNNTSLAHRFIWKTGNKELYHKLLGSYLIPPCWAIRFAQFKGDLIDRAEEYQIVVGPDGAILRSNHIIPETMSGTELNENEARELVHKHLSTIFDLSQLKEASIQTEQKPNRKDWNFTFIDTSISIPKQGDARVSVVLSGNIITDTYLFIHVPEEWERADRKEQNTLRMCKTFIMCPYHLLVLLGIFLFFFLMHHSIKSLLSRFISLFILLGMGSSLHIINTWPSLAAIYLNTAEPLFSQLLRIVSFICICTLIDTCATYLKILASLLLPKASRFTNFIQVFLVGTSAGIVGSVAYTFLYKLSDLYYSAQPLWPNFNALAAYSPILSFVYSTLFYYFFITILFIFLHIFLSYAEQKGFAALNYLILLAAGIVTVDPFLMPSLLIWFLGGISMGMLYIILYFTLIQKDCATIPFATAIVLLGNLIQQSIWSAYPFAVVHAITAGISLVFVSFIWSYYIHYNTQHQ